MEGGKRAVWKGGERRPVWNGERRKEVKYLEKRKLGRRKQTKVVGAEQRKGGLWGNGGESRKRDRIEGWRKEEKLGGREKGRKSGWEKVRNGFLVH